MMSSRPEIAIALSLALMPDLETALLIASMTVGAWRQRECTVVATKTQMPLKLAPVSDDWTNAAGRVRLRPHHQPPDGNLDRPRRRVDGARGPHDDAVGGPRVVPDTHGAGSLGRREPGKHGAFQRGQVDPWRVRGARRHEPAPCAIAVGGCRKQAVAELHPGLGQPAGPRRVVEVPRDPRLERAHGAGREREAAEGHENQQPEG